MGCYHLLARVEAGKKQFTPLASAECQQNGMGRGMKSNRRTKNRNRCFMQAVIYRDDSYEPILAEVHDISENGLRLFVLNARHLPSEFTVVIPRRRLTERVKVARRSNNEVGVLILPPFIVEVHKRWRLSA